jgi:enoyl-CoA hydratase/carnithine racemase
MARLGRLVGRGRAAEILLGGDDFPAALAERYGYVNRVLPDAGLAEFVDVFARRIAGFDKTAVAGIKSLLDVASLPPDDELAPGLAAFFRTSARPESAERGPGQVPAGERSADSQWGGTGPLARSGRD